MGLGESLLAEPLTGWWTLSGFPEQVFLAGRRFLGARWKDEYPDVVEQYREAVPRNSMHLKISRDGRWVIDHIDEDNPDLGREIPHFFNDHAFGRFLKAAGVVVGVAGCACLAIAIADEVLSALAPGH